MHTTLSRVKALFFFTLLLPVLAFAQAAAVPVLDPTDPGNVAKLLLDGIAHKQWGLVISVAVTAIVALLRKYVPETTALGLWFKSKLGGILTNFIVSLGLAFVVQFVAGQPFNLTLVIDAFGVALTAAGGWAIIKNLTEAVQEAKAQKAGTDAAAAPTDTLNK